MAGREMAEREMGGREEGRGSTWPLSAIDRSSNNQIMQDNTIQGEMSCLRGEQRCH